MVRLVARLRRPADVRAAVLRARALVSALDDALAATDPAAAGRGAPPRGPLSPAQRAAVAEAAEAARGDMAALETEHAAAERLAADWAERARRAAAAGRPDLQAAAAACGREQAAAAAELALELTRVGEELAWLGVVPGGDGARLPAPEA